MNPSNDAEILMRFSNLQVTNVKEDLQKRLEVKASNHAHFETAVKFFLESVPAGRNRAEALTNLETALMYANKAIMND